MNEKREEKSIIIKDKLKEKGEKLKELEKQKNIQRKLLKKKLERMQAKKAEFDKIKEQKLLILKNIRNDKIKRNKTNKSAIELNESKKRKAILLLEEEKFDRALSRELKSDSVKSNSRHKTLGKQKYKDEKLKYFLKEINNLKNQSMMKKNDKQKRQIYINKLRREAEERKKEEEKRLEALGL